MDARPTSPERESAVHRRLKWAAILAPVALVGVLEAVRWTVDGPRDTWQERLWVDAAVLVAALAFYCGLFAALDRRRATLQRRNDELEALHDAGLAITAELGLDAVLGKVVERARRLSGTRYGALAVVSESGEIDTFVTAGIDETTRRRIGDPPRGRGLLGVTLREGQRLRLDVLQDDPRTCGFPREHPEMQSLLAVPIICRSPFRGNLYLSERVDGRPFSDRDEETLARFATQAAIAIDNADLHRRVRALDLAHERVRIAHELHDGQAQVLAYVNTKAQAVLEFLRAGKNEQATAQLVELAAAARQVYADVREDILGLRSAVDPERGIAAALSEYVDDWQERHGIAAFLEVTGAPRLALDVELQLVRIVQEALANVRKHAGARQVRVQLIAGDEQFRLTVEDDGRGFRLEAFERHRIPRFGLATMRERAEAIGALLELRSVPGEGTRLELLYPAGREARPTFGRSQEARRPVASAPETSPVELVDR